ncbi:MAG: ParA family protein [Acidimicrobiia bacterium]|nr:ParA family protein [Acidimicrobiia bacterium]MDH5421455.1 ParA family protein [Acidimicrobiia bacterium]MDH5503060.1 ParA family protein [Acidimicrobiia bacterium]
MNNALMFGNGKGGVGKTSLAANVAGLAAHAGWRVLAVDLDPQGNLGSDLGYKQDGLGDEGEGLLQAIVAGRPISPITNVRPRLDAIAAGRSTTDVWAVVNNRRSVDAEAIGDLATVLDPLSRAYDLVVIDSPPAGGVAVDAALAASRWLVIPVKFDDGSIDGLELMARQFGAAKSTVNPALELLGVALFDFSTAGTAIRREVRTQLTADLGGIAPVLKSVIRRAERAAYDMRRTGLLAHEYQAKAVESNQRVSIAERIRLSRAGQAAPQYSSAADGLAEDYAKLATELLLSLGDLHSRVGR